ncbi:hypothetical protein V6N11_083103 [Hibiscus sabdariffa]|uniref:Uncharacterized protein n=1 Tax=Hibiscus sabdariffa TaxID=183260 RepID=A0ABR2QKX0_9ROSI
MEQHTDIPSNATPDSVSPSNGEATSAELPPPAPSTQFSTPSTMTSPNEHDVSASTHDHSSTNVHHMVTRNKRGIFKPKLYSLTSGITPKSVHGALNHPDWSPAVLAEFKALQDSSTWDNVDLP